MQATDVTVAPHQVSGFNPAGIGTARNVTVTVTSGSPTVTTTGTQFQPWVGLGGFRVLIGGTFYYVASVNTNASLTLSANFAGATGSATLTFYPHIEVRVFNTGLAFYPKNGYNPSDGSNQNQIAKGAPGGNPAFLRYAASIINGVLWVPEMLLPATTDGQPNTSTLTVAYYLPSGAPVQGVAAFYKCGEKSDLRIPPNTPTSWLAICEYNRTNSPPLPENYYTASQIDARFPSCTTAQMVYYAATGNKQNCLTLGANLSITDGVLNATGGGGALTVAAKSGTPSFASPSSLLADDVAGGIYLVTDGGHPKFGVQPGLGISVLNSVNVDQSYTFNWSAAHTHAVNSTQSATTAATSFQPSTNPTNGQHRFSPSINFLGLANSGSGVTPTAFRMYTKTADSNGTARFVVEYRNNLLTSNWTEGFALNQSGQISTGNLVNLSQLPSMTDARLLGRSAGSSGAPQEITIGPGLTLSGGVLDSAGGAGAMATSNLGVNLSPTRTKFNFPWEFLRSTDNSSLSATDLMTQRTPTGVYNAITDLNASGDARLYQIAANLVTGATTATITGTTWEAFNGAPDNSISSIYPLRYYANSQNTWRVGQGIRIPNGVSSSQDLIAVVTGVSGNTITFSPAVTNPLASTDSPNLINFIQHDDTAVLQSWFNTYSAGRLYFPEGAYPISTFHNYSAGKTQALSIAASSEAYNHQYILEGAGHYRSFLFHTGPGHAIKAGNTNNLIVRGLYIGHSNRYSLQAIDTDSAGAALYLASDVSDSDGVPQSNATNVLAEHNMFLGWRYGIFSDNLQSSVIRNNSFYYDATPIALVGTNTIRGLGAATEPNANQLDHNLIQYSPNLTGARRTLSAAATIAKGSHTLTCTGANFTSNDLYRIVAISGAGVNGVQHYTVITSIISSTQATISQAPWTAVSGVNLEIYPLALADIYLQNANVTGIRGGTYQGSRTTGTPGETYGILAENMDSLHIDSWWYESTAQTSIRLNNVRSARIDNSTFSSSTGAALYLSNVTGLRVDGSYIGTSGGAQDVVAVGGTRGVQIDNSTLTGANVSYGSTTDTGANYWPIEFGPNVRYLDSSANGGMRSTEHLADSFLARSEAVNGNFADGLTGWTQNQPAALTAVNTGTSRGLRYVKITPSTGGGNSYVTQLSQTISIHNSVQALTPLSLGFDWYIESRGTDSIGSAPTYNELRVKLVYSNGETTPLSFNPSAAYGFITGRWNRASIQTRVPSGTSRTVQIVIECGQGANAAIFRVANFRLTYSTRATFDEDEPITELKGGTIRVGSTFKFADAAGSGTRTVCVDNNGAVSFGVCGGGGGGGGGTGDVTGPASSTTTAVARFNGTTGKIIQNSAVTLDGSGNLAGVGTVNTHTIPGGTDTFALLTANQALTNKTVNGLTITTTTGTFTLTSGKTATISNTLTFNGTDSSTVAFGAGGTVLYNGGALGTPSSATLTNATGLPIATGVSGLGANVAAFLATPSSSNFSAALTTKTGSGTVVFDTQPTISKPVFTSYTFAALPTPATDMVVVVTDCANTACSSGGGSTVRQVRYNGSAWAVLGDGDSGGTPAFSSITAGTNTAALVVGTGGSLSVSGTGTIAATSVTGLSVTAGKTFTVQNSVTISGTDGTTFTLPSLSGSLLTADSTNALTNKVYNTAGTGNTFQINGTTINAVSGSGAVALVNGATFIAPVLGAATATSINKVSFTAPATGATLAIADGQTLTITNSFTATASGSPTVAFGAGGTVLYNGGALGTPSSATLTNATGLPISSGVSGLGTNVATFLATPSSANLANALTTKTGSGNAVFGTQATLDKPLITSYTFAGLPTPVTDMVVVVTDCANTACSAGGGSTVRQLRYNGSAWAVLGDGDSGVAPAFSSITAGTNTAALAIGSGGSLGVSGTGVIYATNVVGTAGASPTASGTIAYDTASNTLEFGVNGVNKTVLATDGNGSALTNLNASNLASGTVPAARLGSGTANSTTVLFGDNVFRTLSLADGTTLSDSGTTISVNQSNSFAWTIAHTHTVAIGTLGNTSTSPNSFLTVSPTTAPSSSNYKVSPSLILRAQYDAGAGVKQSGYRLYTDIGGTTGASDFLVQFNDSATGSGWTSALRVNTTNVTVAGTLNSHTIPAVSADTYTLNNATQTLIGKTIDVEAAGNTVTTVSKIWLEAASNNAGTAAANWDLPASNAPTAAAITGTNVLQGVLDFPDGATDLTAQRTLHLPADWTGNIDVKFKWLSSTTSGNVIWGVAAACAADGVTNDPSFTTWNDASPDAAKGTANQTNDASVTSITTTGSCAAGSLIHFNIARRLSQAGDTMAGTARLIGVEITMRRAQ